MFEKLKLLGKRAKTDTPSTFIKGVEETKSDIIIDGLYNPVEWLASTDEKYHRWRWKLSCMQDKNPMAKAMLGLKEIDRFTKIYFNIYDTNENISAFIMDMINYGIRGVAINSMNKGEVKSFVYADQLTSTINYKKKHDISDDPSILNTLCKKSRDVYTSINHLIVPRIDDSFYDYLGTINSDTSMIIAGIGLMSSDGIVDGEIDKKNIVFTIFTSCIDTIGSHGMRDWIADPYSVVVSPKKVNPYYLVDMRPMDLLNLRDHIVETTTKSEEYPTILNDIDNILKVAGSLK